MDTQTERPAGPASITSEGDIQIFIQIKISEHFLKRQKGELSNLCPWPIGNNFARNLLSLAMEYAMRFDDVQIREGSQGEYGELHDSGYTFRVDDLQDAVRSINDILNKIYLGEKDGFKGMATIHYRKSEDSPVQHVCTGKADESKFNVDEFMRRIAACPDPVLRKKPPESNN